MPETIHLREVEIQVRQPGLRTRNQIVITTLTSGQDYPREELAEAYRARWRVELDLRSIKFVMQMDVLRCKTPEMVRKEVWMHLLAYNLIRRLMSEAAASAKIHPCEVNFKGTLPTFLAFTTSRWGKTTLKAQALYQPDFPPI